MLVGAAVVADVIEKLVRREARVPFEQLPAEPPQTKSELCGGAKVFQARGVGGMVVARRARARVARARACIVQRAPPQNLHRSEWSGISLPQNLHWPMVVASAVPPEMTPGVSVALEVRGLADANLGSIGSLGGIAERDESSDRGSVAESSCSDGIDSPSPIAGIESIIDNELDGAVLARVLARSTDA